MALLYSRIIRNNVPASLQTLICCLLSVQYSRECVRNPEELWRSWTGRGRENGLNVRNGDEKMKKILKKFQEVFQVMTANECIRKRIKAKKQHEIDRIVELVSQIQTFYSEKNGEKGKVSGGIQLEVCRSNRQFGRHRRRSRSLVADYRTQKQVGSDGRRRKSTGL